MLKTNRANYYINMASPYEIFLERFLHCVASLFIRNTLVLPLYLRYQLGTRHISRGN